MNLRHLAAACVALTVLGACRAGGPDLAIRQWTDDMTFVITSDPLPPRAREPIRYKVVVRDSKTGEPIESGEGRIFASTRDGVNVYDVFDKGEELGTYYATMHYVTAGEWAVAIQFRRDSTQKLERMDWMQEVFSARGEKN